MPSRSRPVSSLPSGGAISETLVTPGNLGRRILAIWAVFGRLERDEPLDAGGRAQPQDRPPEGSPSTRSGQGAGTSWGRVEQVDVFALTITTRATSPGVAAALTLMNCRRQNRRPRETSSPVPRWVPSPQ